jgi:type IV pilus assembly protein PilC
VIVSEADRVRVLVTLAAGLRAGISLPQALHYLESAVRSDTVSLVRDTRIRLENGLTLSQAGHLAPALFPGPLPAVIGVAEKLGNLPETLDRLAMARGRAHKRRTRTMMSLIYPLSMLAIGIPAVWMAATTLLPQIAASARSMGQDIPAPTLMLIEVVSALSRWRVVGTSVALASGVVYWLRRRNAREMLWSMPLIGPILTDGAWADLAGVLVLCLGSAMPLPEALRLAGNGIVCGKVHIAAEASARRLDTGVPLHLAVADFQPMLKRAIVSGAETGDLINAVGQVATLLDNGVEMRLEALAGLVQPVMTVLVTGFLGFMSILICLPVIRPAIPE